MYDIFNIIPNTINTDHFMQIPGTPFSNMD